MPRELAPLSHVPDLRVRVYDFAKENGLIVNEDMLKKLEWMIRHGGRCFCDWESGRRCPCDNVFDDIVEYNGTCLCNLLHTPEKHKRWEESKTKKHKKRKPDKTKKQKEIELMRLKEAEEIYKKMVGGCMMNLATSTTTDSGSEFCLERFVVSSEFGTRSSL